MRRELMLLALTTVALIATSRQFPCATETVGFDVATNCGKATSITFTSSASCNVKVKGGVGSGLPIRGTVELRSSNVEDAGVLRGFMWMNDAGIACRAEPADGGLSIDCGSCGGMLTR